MSTDPNPADREEAARRDMAQALAVVMYSALPPQSGELPRLEFTNRYAIEYFGIDPEEIAGDRWIELVHPDDRAGVRVTWQAALESGQQYHNLRRVRLADGSYRRFLAQTLPLQGEGGEVLKWYGVVTPLEGPRLSESRPLPGRLDYYPLTDSGGLIHILQVAIWEDRPDDPAAKRHPSGNW